MTKKKPIPEVIIKDTVKPLQVTLETGNQKQDIINKGDGKTVAPKTTEQEDLVTARQSRINLIWETTQAVIAVSISWAVIYCQVKEITSEILNNAFFLIVSMYYVRTNHNRIGGVGHKPDNQQR